jgi:ethanolamine utilization protein EutN
VKIGTVIGQLVATCKHEHLHGCRMLVVQPETLDGLDGGEAILAVDRVGADVGQRVLWVDDGSAARGLLGLTGPIRTIIVGVVDEVAVARRGAT